MATRSAASSATKVVSPPPAKAKDSAWTSAKKTARKRAEDLSVAPATSVMELDVADFPRLSSDPADISPPASTLVSVDSVLTKSQISLSIASSTAVDSSASSLPSIATISQPSSTSTATTSQPSSTPLISTALPSSSSADGSPMVVDPTSSPSPSSLSSPASVPPSSSFSSSSRRSSLMDAARSTTPPRHNLSPASRPFRFYFNLQVQPSQPLVNNPTAQQRIDAYRASFIAVLEALYKIDETIALWPFEEPTIHEAGLLTNPTALGHSIHQITRFFDGFRIRNDFPPCYVVVLLGFSMDFDVFMENARVMLPDAHAKLYKRLLQAPHVTCIGWLLGSHDDLALPPLERLLQEVLLKTASTPIPTPKIALTYKPIWDGSKRSDRAPSSFKTGRQGTWAAHVDVETSQALVLKSLFKRALKSSAVKAYTNLPLLLVPVLTVKTLSQEADDILFAQAQQKTAQSALSKHFTLKIRSLDRPLASLDNATLRTTIMAVAAPDGKHLFLSVDPSWNGQGYVVTFSKKISCHCTRVCRIPSVLPSTCSRRCGFSVVYSGSGCGS